MPKNEARAAVALIEIAQPTPAVLIVQRQASPRDPWSGHWALPGGKRETQDDDLQATAIRETREECGIVLPAASKELPVHTAGSYVGRQVLVQPYLFHLTSLPDLQLETGEIAASHLLPLGTLQDHSAYTRGPIPGIGGEFPQMALTTHTAMPLWGFTFEVLTQYYQVSPLP